MSRLVWRTLVRTPRRLAVGIVGVAVPVALLAAMLFFVDGATRTMSARALTNVKVDMEAVVTKPTVDTKALSAQLAGVAGVTRAERFAAVDMDATLAGAPAGAAPARVRLFAVDPSYLANHPWVRVTGGSFGTGALVSDALAGRPGGSSATNVEVVLPGGTDPAHLTVGGTVDLRDATPWWALPSGDQQGDPVFNPDAILVDYATFERAILPSLRADFAARGPAQPSANLTSLPPVSIESQLTLDRSIFASDPSTAAKKSLALRRTLERVDPGNVRVVDNVAEALNAARADATNAKILFLLLGIPGVLVAGALSLTTATALAASQRRELALLRLRGATNRQLVRLALITTVAVGVLGSAVGVALGYGGVAALLGTSTLRGVSGTRLTVSVLLAVLAGLTVTALRLLPLARAARQASIAVERRVLDRGWAPTWMRRRLDVVAIVIGAGILGVNILTGGFRRTAGAETQTLALGFFVLIGPILLWIGLTLAAVRGMAIALARITRPERARPLGTWRSANLRWIGRRPARTGTTIVLGALAVGFGVNILAFVRTYEVARSHDTTMAVGSDVRVIPAQVSPPPEPPLNAPDVAASTPIRNIFATVGTDRQSALVVDRASYRSAVSQAPIIQSGGGLDALFADPQGVLVDWQFARDFSVAPGDPLNVTFTDPATKVAHVVSLHTIGVYRAVAPGSPSANFMIASAALPIPAPPPDFYLVRVAPGHTVAEVTDRINQAAGSTGAWRVATIADALQREQNTLSSLDLHGLSRLETAGTALIAALGVAVLGAFLVLERRAEFSVLRSVGASTGQLLMGPALEGGLTIGMSLLIGVPVGLIVATVSTRVLTLLFALPAPYLRPPGPQLGALGLLVVGCSAVALAASLAVVARLRPAAELRAT